MKKLLIPLLSTFIATAAFGQACIKSGTGVFCGDSNIGNIEMQYGASGTFIASSNGTRTFSVDASGNQSLGGNFLPSTNNAFDVGSSALRWKSGYFGSGMNINKTPVSAGDGYVSGMTGTPAGITASNIFVSEPFTLAGLALLSYGNNAGGQIFALSKTRAATPGTNTIVQNGDVIADIVFSGADGSNYKAAAQIEVKVDGTPSNGADMPGSIDFQVSPDGSATTASALKISNDKSIVFGGTLIGSGTATIGWTVTSILANTACSTRCTTPAVLGFGLTGDAAFPITGFFDGASASSDICLCAGAS